MAIILIVEDEQRIRELLEATLSLDHQVVPAANAAHAIEYALRLRPDLILLDLNLQGHHDGLEVCRTLRSEADPILAQVPIVILTGQATKADIAAALAAGADAYVRKPYRLNDLLTVVTTHLADRSV